MAKKEIFVAWGVHVDAVAGWLGSYGGEDSPTDISRGIFSGEVGSPRILKMLKKYNLPSTWFIPGHSIESFPEQMQAVADAGCEIALHGYSHEDPMTMTAAQETAVLEKCIDLIEKLCGKKPVGYDAPWWQFSDITDKLLIDHGIIYDNSLMHNDFHPYYLRIGDSWTKIDYSKNAEDWMKPLVRGRVTDLVEIPASWYLDDLPPMMFQKASPTSYGFESPRNIGQMWIDQFDYVYREYDYAVVPMCIHPDVSGHPQNILMNERVIEHMMAHEGVKFVTYKEVAEDFMKRFPREKE